MHPAKQHPGDTSKGSSTGEGLPPAASIILSMVPQDLGAVSTNRISRLNALFGGKYSSTIGSRATGSLAMLAALESSKSIPTSSSVLEVGNTLTSQARHGGGAVVRVQRGAADGMGSW